MCNEKPDNGNIYNENVKKAQKILEIVARYYIADEARKYDNHINQIEEASKRNIEAEKRIIRRI